MPETAPSPWSTWTSKFHLTHECLCPPHSARQTTARSLYALSHNDATKSPLVRLYNGTPQIHPPNCPFPFDDHHQNLMHPYRARLHSPPQMASGSNQPCCHCSRVRTDRWDKQKFNHMSMMSAPLYRERRANNGQSFIFLLIHETGTKKTKH